MQINDYLLAIGMFALIVGLIFWRQIARSIERKRLQKKGLLLKGTATVLQAKLNETNRVTGQSYQYKVYECQVEIEVTSATHHAFITTIYRNVNKKDHNLKTIFSIGKKFDVEFDKNDTSNIFFDLFEVNRMDHP